MIDTKQWLSYKTVGDLYRSNRPSTRLATKYCPKYHGKKWKL